MGNEEPLLQSGYPKSPTDRSPDGRFLLFQQLDPQTKYDVWVLPLEGERKPAPLVHGNRNDMDGQSKPSNR